MSWSNLFALLNLRARLLARQKLGYVSGALGLILVLISFVFADVSFSKPDKIFWDISLGIIFVLQLSLSLYLGTQLLNDERNRRTLHLILSCGVSRGTWLLGNALGVWVVTTLMSLLWFLLTAGTCFVKYGHGADLMAFQAWIGISLESLVLVFFGFFLSVFVRPLLALMAGFSMTLFLHSLSALRRIFTEPGLGKGIDDAESSLVIRLAKFLPPLEWWDLKIFVGYESQVSWSLMAQMLGLSVLWAYLFWSFATFKFERMDL